MTQDDYGLVLFFGAVLFWLALFPLLLSRFGRRYYDMLPDYVKRFLLLILPSLGKIMLDKWTAFRDNVATPAVRDTPTQLDDAMLVEIDKRVLETIERYFNEHIQSNR